VNYEDMPVWESLPEKVLEDMKWLGSFGPTVNIESRELKGSMADHEEGGCYKTYLNVRDLRQLAISCLVAADWLDQRAALKAVAK
jgi:hypothetical protein